MADRLNDDTATAAQGSLRARAGGSQRIPMKRDGRSSSAAIGTVLGILVSAVAAVAGVAAVAAVAACASDSEVPAPSSPTESNGGVDAIGTYDVVTAQVTFVDESRSTKAHGGRPALPSRTLPVEVRYPEPVGGAHRGAFPLIVFSHGSTRRAEHYHRTLDAWASAGYVVVGPDFPLSKEGTPGGTDYAGIAEQAGDVSFVIDRVLASSSDPQRPWAALVDPHRIGLGGQSLGAITTVAVGINPCCVDDRVDAITEFAGAWADLGSAGPVAADAAPPALLVHGDADPTVPYAMGEALLELHPGDRRLLTLVGTGHDAGYFGGLDEPLDELVTRATVCFYDLHLKDDPDAAARLEALVARAGPEVATLSPRSPG